MLVKRGYKSFLEFAVVMFSVLVALPVIGFDSFVFAEQSTDAIQALPGEPCKVEPLKDWTPQEKWVWKQVCEGEIADFNKGEKYGGFLDPKKPDDWQNNRILRSTFLETILLYEPYRSSLPRHGVRIIGAWFTDSLDLSNSRLDHQLWMDKCRFEKDVDLNRLNSTGLISLMGSKFNGKLNMSSLEVKSHLFMSDGFEVTTSTPTKLIFSVIGGNLDLSGSNLNSLDLSNTHIGKELLLGSMEAPPAKWKQAAKLTLRNTEVGALQDHPEAWPDELELDLGFSLYREYPFKGFSLNQLLLTA